MEMSLDYDTVALDVARCSFALFCSCMHIFPLIRFHLFFFHLPPLI